MSENNPDKVALTPGEFAALFGKSQTWGYRQLYNGKVKAITGYGRTLIPISEVEKVLGEAGRYLGAATPIEAATEALRADKPASKSRNPWKNAVSRRREGKSRTCSKNTAQGAKLRKSLRSAALRKMNRSGRQ